MDAKIIRGMDKDMAVSLVIPARSAGGQPLENQDMAVTPEQFTSSVTMSAGR